MREKEVEKKLVDEVKKRGGLCLKFVSPGFNGVPDRLLLLNKGKLSFVEVKRPGKKPRKLQVHCHNLLRRLGFQVFVLDDVSQIEEIISETERGKRTDGI